MSSRPLDARTKAINAAMRRAAKTAASRARAAGTKLYVLPDGKVVAESPQQTTNNGLTPSVSLYRPIEQLIVASDVMITRGTRNITVEAQALRKRTISLSPNTNPFDDILVPRIRTNIALNASALEGPALLQYFQQVLSEAESEDTRDLPLSHCSLGCSLPQTLIAEINRLRTSVVSP